MFWKRTIPIAIVATVGFLTLFGWFVDEPHIKNFVEDDATQWYDILASFAIFLGALNLLKMQSQKILKKQTGWQYSIFAVGGFIFAIIAGFVIKGNDAIQWGAHVTGKGTLFKWMFEFMFTPLSATMFALLAFFVASASYRAFRIRNFEATLLLISGIIIMLGRVPIGIKISAWFVLYLTILGIGVVVNNAFKNKQITLGFVVGGLLLTTIAGFWMGWPVDQPALFYLPILQDWIYNIPNVAGARAIMMGIGLGIFATSMRYILGIEKSYIGE
ncbi:MAG: hypothetical protein HN657_00910 [Candidatus Marinimicrobia bacterium]|jgi:hypothetical protein|nr:hypothetical protein [Candidatus Neomarinimicrobiota bacterium]MBT3496861.1 hypothetical protein [Candidatus Neomarinimicrobiota bacterium]MBT3691712.1 hypothetical protein [Candidatus Neomarinimicrobiota bacterium]MBT4143726.1 hypothetical protein [Candidatus Neomarinimicrobiota bacterium]MBT4177089.1 hypothetical protein [Candidatus Neomarinimicrobiota bacterium]